MASWMAVAKHNGHTEASRKEILALQKLFLPQLYAHYKIARSDFFNGLLGRAPSRFSLQALWLSEGYGFRETTKSGRYCTSLPPGQPLVLSLFFQATNNVNTHRFFQSVVPWLSSVLVFFSLRNCGRVRHPASFLIASAPWLTALSSCHMPETTSTFLMSLMTFLTSILPTQIHLSSTTFQNELAKKHTKQRTTNLKLAARSLGLGITSSLAILTAPGLVFQPSCSLHH